MHSIQSITYKIAFVFAVLLHPVLSYGRDYQTYLPTIELTFSTLNHETFSPAYIRVTDMDKTMAFNAEIRHRGSSSLKYQKQSYSIKLLDDTNQKVDTSLLGLRKDNYWILDAMAVDKARMRNRVAMELWMDFSTPPSYVTKEKELQNGSNGKFVEVYVNGDYRGIYCLAERIDRKQLKLKKNQGDAIRGVLYKSVSWKGVFFGDDILPYDNTSDTWMRYEYEYPDPEDSLITWTPLYDAFNFAKNSDTETFINNAADWYDIPVFMDYYLLTALLSARDNRGKNIYLSYYNIQANSKLVPTPWDIDHSFGRMYNSDEESTETTVSNWGPNLFGRLRSEMPGYEKSLFDRYAYLRANVFSHDSLQSRFAHYFSLFQSTGAGEREIARWNGVDGINLDFDYEEGYISEWLTDRLKYIDALFSYEENATTSNPLETPIVPPVKRIENGQIYIYYKGHKYNMMGIEIMQLSNQ